MSKKHVQQVSWLKLPKETTNICIIHSQSYLKNEKHSYREGTMSCYPLYTRALAHNRQFLKAYSYMTSTQDCYRLQIIKTLQRIFKHF